MALDLSRQLPSSSWWESSWLGASVLSLGEWLFKKMPLVSYIYTASKQNHADPTSRAFKEVAMLRHLRIEIIASVGMLMPRSLSSVEANPDLREHFQLARSPKFAGTED